MTNIEDLKKLAAEAAIKHVVEDAILGIGTGSTINYFIDALAPIKHKIAGAIVSSKATEERVRKLNIPIVELNSVDNLPIYVDGADEIDSHMQMIKGGGAALTREKIIAAVAKKFICIADQQKKVTVLGAFPLPIEVIPMARSYVAREIVKLGGNPTDNGNVILDVWNLNFTESSKLEQIINNITGVVTNGIFALRRADVLLLGTEAGVQIFERII